MLRLLLPIVALVAASGCHGLSFLSTTESISRRSAFGRAAGWVTASTTTTTAAAVVLSNSGVANAVGSDLSFQTSASGIQWADAKVGSGNPFQSGGTATIDYVMSTTGARYGTKIYSTTDKDTPYRWKLGDGTTIAGIEKAILGDNDVGGSMPPMKPGGIRRVVIPQSLGYTKLAEAPKTLCVQDGTPGPIPPPNQAFEEYQRFKNIYCNPERQYQPDLVMDVKLYGSR